MVHRMTAFAPVFHIGPLPDVARGGYAEDVKLPPDP